MFYWKSAFGAFMSIRQAMKRAAIICAAVAIVSVLAVRNGSADTLSLSGIGTPGVLPGTFNPSGTAAISADGIGVGTAITIFSGVSNTGGLSVSPNTSLTFTFMGKEAGYTNQLLFGNTVLFSNNVAPGTSSAPITANGGLLPFLFRAVTPGNLNANNGGAIAPGLQIAFARVSETVFYIFFDDGGAGPDKDFDDMVVRVTDPIATPLPGALPLFAGGLGTLGLLRWRRKRKNAAVA
jgi:hypothetical protein